MVLYLFEEFTCNSSRSKASSDFWEPVYPSNFMGVGEPNRRHSKSEIRPSFLTSFFAALGIIM